MRDEIRRPSAWVLSGVVGLFAASAHILLGIETGQTQPAAWYFWTGMIWATGTLGALHVGWGAVLGLVWLVQAWPEAVAENSEEPPNTPATPITHPQGAFGSAATLPTPEEQARAVEVHHWRIAVHRFLCAGDAYGFGIRKLAKEPETKVIAWNAWGDMTRLLRDAGILAGSGDGTGWAVGWSLPRWQDERDRVILPYPKGGPPTVEAPPYRKATQQQSNGQTVVDA